ncbi:ChpA [Pseudomonas aeruginosa]|nr:ChpA [Pseudomonas aeruginosa]
MPSRKAAWRVSPAFFEEARQAHEALIGMMDQVAAGLQVTPRPERVAALQELLEAPAAEAVPFIDPESLGADDFPPEDEEPALPEAVFEEAGTPAEETVPAAPAPAPGRELDEEMVSIFLEEAVDILESAGQALAQWQAEPARCLRSAPCSATCIPSRAAHGWPRSPRSATWPTSWRPSTKDWSTAVTSTPRNWPDCCKPVTTAWPNSSTS